jgi:hypothetical protein
VPALARPAEAAAGSVTAHVGLLVVEEAEGKVELDGAHLHVRIQREVPATAGESYADELVAHLGARVAMAAGHEASS